MRHKARGALTRHHFGALKAARFGPLGLFSTACCLPNNSSRSTVKENKVPVHIPSSMKEGRQQHILSFVVDGGVFEHRNVQRLEEKDGTY